MMEYDFHWVVVYTICLQDNTSADMAFLYCFNLLTQYFKAVLPSVKNQAKSLMMLKQLPVLLILWCFAVFADDSDVTNIEFNEEV